MSRRDQRGTVVVELTWLSLLLLVPLLYIVLAVFWTQRSAFAASEAAREAGRAFVTAASEAAAPGRAVAAARLALDDQGVPADRVRLDWTCAPRPGDCLSSGSTVTVRVAYLVPLPLLPSALGGQAPGITVTAEHRESYGTFREDR